MFYYTYKDACLASGREDLPYAHLEGAPESVEHLYVLLERGPQACRAAFPVEYPAQLTLEEGVNWLDSGSMTGGGEPVLTPLIGAGLVSAVNTGHPRWEELLTKPETGKKRLNILAMGDVGSTLAIGLRLLGGETLSSIGICDIGASTASRWEMELNQIARPWDYDAMPEVEVISADALFDGDVFLFCASKGLPPVGAQVADVRMAQYEANADLIADYAKTAARKEYKGLFCVVSDPVDLLCSAALAATAKTGHPLFPQQIMGFGLGVMNARAAYYAKRDPALASFLTQGRAYGPHGAYLVIANSVQAYDDALSRELTRRTVEANLAVRDLGFKPYVAPALSSGALSILDALSGRWHYSATYLGGVYMGAKNRATPYGPQVEALPLPPPLMERIHAAARFLRDNGREE